ncbi:hypothetical protein [Myxococcus sp. CA039A]|uniref:hypothetical protein n=1 Tax=Myxococcus sp. CA039A TaxID=2741737 RepID=UPI00157A4370|nr:hypothetical protein [Myxococcus sp. CA039A]NTX54290.1 hypothetical protein [Myxococcus sp. CA039A]
MRVISLLPPEVAVVGGIPRRAIAGTLGGNPDDLSAFTPEPDFVALIHEVVRDYTPQDSAAQEEARRMGSGWLYIVDQRWSQSGARTAPKDIVGYFRVEEGRIQQASYTPHQGYIVFTERGLTRLPGSLHGVLVARAAQ